MNRKALIPTILILAGTVAAVYVFGFRSASAAEAPLSGTVEATDVDLGFQIAGRISTIGPHEGDVVHAGDTLAVLDRSELVARRAQADAALAAAQAGLAELERGSRTQELTQAREADSTATARLANAQDDFDRTQKLFQGGAVPRDAFDRASLALTVARNAKAQASAQLDLVRAGPRVERIAAQRATVEQAVAGVRQAAAALRQGVIVAPFDGVVAVRAREPGETVPAGMPVLTILNRADRWVRIYVREDRIGAVKLGEHASIVSDTYASRTYPGLVSFIASQAEFTPRNVQTAAERVTLVYAVKVRITGDSANDLKPGMPADVRLVGAAQ